MPSACPNHCRYDDNFICYPYTQKGVEGGMPLRCFRCVQVKRQRNRLHDTLANP